MKILKLAFVALLLAWLSFVGFGAYRWYGYFTENRDPLRSERIELEKSKLDRLTEQEKQRTEQERRKSLVLSAKLRRQERLENSQAVSLSAVVLASFVRLFFPLLFSVSCVGGLVYAFTRKVPVKTPFIETLLPARRAAALAEKSLQVSNAAEMGKVLAFQEETTRHRLHDFASLGNAFFRKGIQAGTAAALPAADESEHAGNLPTFAEIFDSREIHGEMILGFENDDTPRVGKYEAVHSCLVYGLARSGKTSFLRGLTGQTVLTEPETLFFVLDPHAARKDSLLGSLPKTRHFKAIDAEHPETVLQGLRDELRRRLLSDEETFPPRILLIDELNEVARREYKPLLVKTCEELSQQGRKVNMFLLAACQDLRKNKIGDFRDTLSSAYFFKGKPNHVKAFLDDPDAAKLYRQNVTRHGVALFSAADEEPRLMLIPECKPRDLRLLEKTPSFSAQVTSGTTNADKPNTETGNEQDAPQAKYDNVLPFRRRDAETHTDTQTQATQTNDTPDTADTQADTSDTDLLTAALEICGNDKKTLSARSGVSVSLIKEMQAGRRRITGDTREKLLTCLTTQGKANA